MTERQRREFIGEIDRQIGVLKRYVAGRRAGACRLVGFYIERLDQEKLWLQSRPVAGP